METGDIIILGLTQGLTEFLPISSSGHLAAARFFLKIPGVSGTAFDAFLHLGTLLAVLLYFWRVWVGIFRGIFISDTEGRDKKELIAKLAVATVPAAVAGYALQDNIEIVLSNIRNVAAGLLLSALLLLIGDFLGKKSKNISRASYTDAAYIGLSQVLALMPGVSRSGVTIAAGRWRGLSRKQAASFSFLLSAPIIMGAGLVSLQHLLSINEYSLRDLSIGLIVSFLSGFLAIHVMLKTVERISLTPFAVYLAMLAAILFYAA